MIRKQMRVDADLLPPISRDVLANKSRFASVGWGTMLPAASDLLCETLRG
jgi:hypothetical protein